MTTPTPPTPISVNDLVRDLLDRGYSRATMATLNAVSADTGSGLIQQRLRELEAEAARLDAAGERLDPNNPVLRALTADLDTMLRQSAMRVDDMAETVQALGVDASAPLTRQLALAGFPQEELARLGIIWNQPDVEAVNRLVQYVDSAGWAEEIAEFGPNILSRVEQIAVNGFAQGWGPIRVARELSNVVETMPRYQANNLMRTLQLQSLRSGTAIHQAANADILEYQVRMATLDSRTCLTCVALHGTRLEIGERVLDHHQGRCFSVTQVRGMPRREIESGQDWWDRQPETVRLQMAGAANFNALQAGAVTLNDFVQRYDDRVFGEMVRESSLKGILGDAAEQYYARNRR
ncbi:hypothetical protein G4Y79_15255 [Phototrophicus methaneseepsis]|uniref:Phage head morphogenesis domain-containing protein n=1 Tax=Phototrophicus methaneseepsis TaxID=2710758 RepID=A0A7S8IC17_9CHLR|nr:hypothetical protein [Phototrophicus methaneseepsis]QPC81060.1 hypothetical protein G4Y79_15255 [Phototrophicus methaneseepsis]